MISTGIRSCRTADELAAAAATMRGSQVHRLPVVDDADQLLGVISLADIAREAAREAGSKRQEVSVAEIGETLAAIWQPREIAATAQGSGGIAAGLGARSAGGRDAVAVPLSVDRAQPIERARVAACRVEAVGGPSVRCASVPRIRLAPAWGSPPHARAAERPASRTRR